MKPETLIALSNLVSKAAKEVELAPGSYSVNETISIDLVATISKLEAELFIGTIMMPWKKAIALALSRAGATRQAMTDLFKSCVVQAATEGSNISDLIASEIEEIEMWEAEVQAIATAAGMKKRAGKTHVKGTIDVTVKGVVKKKKKAV
jgi:hypothetical protein